MAMSYEGSVARHNLHFSLAELRKLLPPMYAQDVQVLSSTILSKLSFLIWLSDQKKKEA